MPGLDDTFCKVPPLAELDPYYNPYQGIFGPQEQQVYMVPAGGRGQPPPGQHQQVPGQPQAPGQNVPGQQVPPPQQVPGQQQQQQNLNDPDEQERRRAARQAARKSIKMVPFEPHMNPVEWWDTYTTYCEIHGYTPENKREYLQFYLGPTASRWYHRSGIKYEPQNVPQGVDALKKSFLDQFCMKEPEVFQHKRNLYDLLQGKDTVVQFCERVIDTVRTMYRKEGGAALSKYELEDAKAAIVGAVSDRARAHLIQKNPQTVQELLDAATTAQFLENNDGNAAHIAAIRRDVSDLVPLKKDIDALKQAAGLLRENNKEKKNKEPPVRLSDVVTAIHSLEDKVTTTDKVKSSFKCFNCDGEGHYARSCPHSPKQEQRPPPQARRDGRPAAQVLPTANKQANGQRRPQRKARQKNRQDRIQVCQWCQRAGHVAVDCWTLRGEQAGVNYIQNQQVEQPAHPAPPYPGRHQQ